MPKVKLYRSGKLICETTGNLGDTLLQCIKTAGVFLDSPCGGLGKCGKCLVHLDSVSNEQVLACQTKIGGDAKVYLPETSEMKIADGGSVHRDATEVQLTAPRSNSSLGVAVDIGTTTVVAHLVDIKTGTKIATASGVNAQRTFGADVISRIQYCVDYGHETLTNLIREQLKALILETCETSNTKTENITYISIAANTIMEHIAAGLSPVGMGTVPFTPVSLFGNETPAWDNLNISKNAKIYYAPAISAYVGGDITAGILASGLEDMPGPALFIDIGTNGEMVLKTGDTYCCCATAAGPAFEGAEISQGMAAVSGAISHVKWDNDTRFQLSVIGNATPQGLCGSGLLDALALLLDTGAVDESGRMLDAEDISHSISKHICKLNDGNALCLSSENEGVYLTAADVRKLQLAKSAIAAGIQTLLQHKNIKQDEIKSFILAGGFGSFLNADSGAKIGLFPGCFLPITSPPGNTAGEGAVLTVCSKAARDALAKIRERCEYIELSTSKVFNEQFVEQMTF